MKNVKFGADIEWFVQDQNEFISAEGLVKGTKKNPFKFDPNNKFFATSLDNVLAEGNIPPVDDPVAWYNAIEKLRSYIDSNLPENVKTVATAAARINEKYLQTENARVFGCEPSLIVWEQCVKNAPDTRTNLRTAGFHVHCSWDNATEEEIEKWVRVMDLYLGVPSVLIEPSNERRINYGVAGEFRFGQSYQGGEYRVLSSYFASDKEKIDWVYNQSVKAVEAINNGFDIDLLSPEASQIVTAINNGDVEISKKLVNKYKLQLI